MATDDEDSALGKVRQFGTRVRNYMRRSASHRPARAALALFVAAALLFSGLLTLPAATRSGHATPFVDALFTAVSAVTVTGLTTVSTAAHWSLLGQVIILIAIQVGALGVVTIALLLVKMVTRRLGVSGRVFAKQSIGAPAVGSVNSLLTTVVVTTLAAEAILALFLIPAFIVSEESFGWGVWYGVFYAVSAFGNAGFSPHEGGLASLGGNVFIFIPIALGVFVGSFGFPVFLNLIHAKWTKYKWTLHTKLTLITTTVLLFFGAAGWALFEWVNPATVGGERWWNKIGQAFFASTMMRSGGFELVAPDASTSTTLLFSDAMMFIGGGSGSTAGGIKVTTLAVLILAVVAEAKGTRDTNALGRRLAHTTMRLAISVVLLGAFLVLAGSLLLTIATDGPLDHVLFEATSAFGTCGLSTGLSAQSGVFGKLVLTALMFIGRVGPIVLASGLAIRQSNEPFSYPTEHPVIG